MLSPFPGMDPYLEGSEWGSFHVELSVEIRRRLSPQVRPNYLVFNAVYDSLGYRAFLDYTQPPEVPLEGETAVWARNLLVQAGHRPEETNT